MSKLIIKTNKAPKPLGNYSQGIKVDNFIYTSGQIPINPKTGELIKGNFKKEVKQAFNNINEILIAGGSSLNNVVKLSIFLIDLSLFKIVDQICNEFFSSSFPTRSIVEVSKLPKQSRIKIEVIGIID